MDANIINTQVFLIIKYYFYVMERFRTLYLGCYGAIGFFIMKTGLLTLPVQEHNEPSTPVRMFTYLIGREISDLEAAKWIACHNKGYFTHVTTLAEVKEQVNIMHSTKLFYIACSLYKRSILYVFLIHIKSIFY